jgi:queuosine precursor transporter
MFLNRLKLPKVNQEGVKTTSNYQYNYLLGMAMMYIMFPLLSGLLIYKPIQYGWFLAPAGILLNPFVYSISNVTTEVYGIEISRNMMWWFIVLSPIFIAVGYVLTHLHSPNSFDHQNSYNMIFGAMPRVCIAGVIGSLAALHFNNVIVSKFKIIFKGKNYWIRSVVGTCGGEVVYNLIAYPIMYINVYAYRSILHIFISVTIFKVIMTMVLVPLECIIQYFLKAKEKSDIYDYDVSYNVFQFFVKKKHEAFSLKVVNNESKKD